MLHRLVTEYDHFVYPLFPLVHPPAVHDLLDSGAYHDSPVFLRRCLSLCAITVASAPNRGPEHCEGRYPTYQAFVDQACDLVLMSRLGTQSSWEEHPTFDSMVDSILLSMAAHYAGRTNRGWALMNEASVALRHLNLHRREELARLSDVEAELAKRVFWTLHMTQIYDYFISPIPRMLQGFPPESTEWEALEPSALPQDVVHASPSLQARQTAPTIVSGFIYLVKLFQCILDVLGTAEYQPYMTHFNRHAGTLGLHAHNLNPADTRAMANRPSETNRLHVARDIDQRLRQVIDCAPDELRYPRYEAWANLDPRSKGLGLSAVTLHLSSVYLTNVLIESISAVPIPPSMHDHDSLAGRDMDLPSPDSAEIKFELWSLRESIVQRLLHILQTPPSILELNGFSLIAQIRKVAASLLDFENDAELDIITNGRSQAYLAQFANILANLDRIPQETTHAPDDDVYGGQRI